MVVVDVGHLIAAKLPLHVFYILRHRLVGSQFARLMQQNLNQLAVDEFANPLVHLLVLSHELHVHLHIHLALCPLMQRGKLILQRVFLGFFLVSVLHRSLVQPLLFLHAIKLNAIPLRVRNASRQKKGGKCS